MTTRLARLAASATAASLLALLPFAGAQATAPVLTGPDSSWTTTGTIVDPHLQASCAVDPDNALPLAEAVCPEFPITLDATSTHVLHYLDVRLDMTPVAAGKTVEDYDIYLYDDNGVEVDLSANALGASEIISLNLVEDGDYTIKVVPYTNLPNSSYTLTARYRTASS